MIGRDDKDDDQSVKLPDHIEYVDIRSSTTITLDVIGALDAGGFGQVVLAKNTKTDETFAVKIGKISTLEKQFLESCNEYFGHGVLYQGESRCLFHVLKVRGDMNLMQMVRESILSGKKISKEQAMNIIRSCVLELLYIHELGLSHNDIQPKNITIDGDGKIYLVDFGSMTKLESDHRDFVYLKDNVCTFIAAIAHTKNHKALLTLLDDMVDSRCGVISKNVVEKILDRYEEIVPIHRVSMVNVFSRFAKQPGVTMLNEMKKANNDYRRFLIAKKFIAENPEHQLSRAMSAAVEVDKRIISPK